MNNLCLYCGGTGQWSAGCSAARQGALLSQTLSHTDTPRPLTPVLLHLSDQTLTTSAFIDSGADSDFMDEEFAKSLNLLQFLDNNTIHSCSLHSNPVHLSIDSYYEDITFYLIKSPHLPLVLGASWLLKHNPHILWSSGKVIGWGLFLVPTLVFGTLFLLQFHQFQRRQMSFQTCQKSQKSVRT